MVSKIMEVSTAADLMPLFGARLDAEPVPLATVHPPTGAEANRAPTPGMALLELLVYLLVFLSLGAWRMSRDA